jgi:hypothetical protein
MNAFVNCLSMASNTVTNFFLLTYVTNGDDDDEGGDNDDGNNADYDDDDDVDARLALVSITHVGSGSLRVNKRFRLGCCLGKTSSVGLFVQQCVCEGARTDFPPLVCLRATRYTPKTLNTA